MLVPPGRPCTGAEARGGGRPCPSALLRGRCRPQHPLDALGSQEPTGTAALGNLLRRGPVARGGEGQAGPREGPSGAACVLRSSWRPGDRKSVV